MIEHSRLLENFFIVYAEFMTAKGVAIGTKNGDQ